MENKELENVIETSWESRDEINEKTVGKTKEAVEQTLNLLGNGTLRVAEKKASGEWVVNQSVSCLSVSFVIAIHFLNTYRCLIQFIHFIDSINIL